MKMKKLGLSKSSEAVQWTLCRLNVGLKWLKHYNNHAQIFILLHSCLWFDRSPSKASTSNHFNSNCHVLKILVLGNFFFRKTNFFSSSSWAPDFVRKKRKLRQDLERVFDALFAACTWTPTGERRERESACVHAKLSLRERERETEREREKEREC